MLTDELVLPVARSVRRLHLNASFCLSALVCTVTEANNNKVRRKADGNLPLWEQNKHTVPVIHSWSYTVEELTSQNGTAVLIWIPPWPRRHYSSCCDALVDTSQPVLMMRSGTNFSLVGKHNKSQLMCAKMSSDLHTRTQCQTYGGKNSLVRC